MADINFSEDRLARLFAEFKYDLFRELQTKLDSKANKTDLIELAKDVGAIKREQAERRHLSADNEDHEKRISYLERAEASRAFLSGWQRWFFGAIVVALIGSVATLVWLAAGSH